MCCCFFCRVSCNVNQRVISQKDTKNATFLAVLKAENLKQNLEQGALFERNSNVIIKPKWNKGTKKENRFHVGIV